LSNWPAKTADLLEAIRNNPPLIHNITNFVVMNFTANVLLALGASPVMAHAPEEVEEMVALSGALVLNIGTLSIPWIDAMFLAGRAANQFKIPIVLDPVGAGATHFRTDTARRLLTELRPTVIRGNASEILTLSDQPSRTRGVDSQDAMDTAHAAAKSLAKKYGVTVAMTGPEDFVTDGQRVALIANGHALMGRITGTGCSASAITAAFCAREKEAFVAATAALGVFGIAGELAAQGTPLPGTFQVRLLDAVAAVDRPTIEKRLRIQTRAME
jgi:hydroxyethylthiazole kinase